MRGFKTYVIATVCSMLLVFGSVSCGGWFPSSGDSWPTVFTSLYQVFKIAKFSARDGSALQSLGIGFLPFGIALDNQGRIYVVDTQGMRIVRMDDITGANQVSFGGPGSGVGQFDNPVKVALDAQGRIYITDGDNLRVVRIDDMSGAGWITFDLTPYVVSSQRTFSLDVDSQGRIYVLSRGDRKIVRFDSMAGDNPVTYGSGGSGVGNFELPNDIFLDGSDRIFVADGGNARIVRFDDMSGANWTAFGTLGTGVGQFDNPNAVCTDSQGRIYIYDSVDSGRIIRMDDMSGSDWAELGSSTTGHAADTGDIAVR